MAEDKQDKKEESESIALYFENIDKMVKKAYKVAREAKKKGLAAIGICDHNSAENVLAVRKVGAANGIYVLGLMEVCSAE